MAEVVIRKEDIMYVGSGIDAAAVAFKGKLDRLEEELSGLWSQDGDTPMTGDTCGEWVKQMLNSVEELKTTLLGKCTAINEALDKALEIAGHGTREKLEPSVQQATKTLDSLSEDVKSFKGKH